MAKMIMVENTTSSKVGIPLKNGDFLSLYPKTRNGKGHISKPFLDSDFPETQSSQMMLQKGKIKIIEVKD